MIVSIVGLLIAGARYFERRGSALKSRQIGDAAEACYEQGGVLFIEKMKGGLILTCREMRITIEVPAPAVDCPKQAELIRELIRKDYIQMRTGQCL